MYPRTNRNKNRRQPNENRIRGEDRADESFDLISSIGNRALIDNLDELLSGEEDIPGNDPRNQDMITQWPVHRLRGSGGKNIISEDEDDSSSEESDVSSISVEETRLKRYDEDSLSEIPIKPLKQKKAEKKAKKPSAGKRYANDINIMNEDNIMNDDLITNRKKKKPLVGMPEKDTDSEDSKFGYLEPLIKIADSEVEENNIDADSDKAGGISNIGDIAGIGRAGFGKKIAENEELLLLDAIDPAAGEPQFDDESDEEETGPTYANRDPSLVVEGTRAKKGKASGNDLLLPQRSIVEGLEELDPDKKWKDEALEYAREQSDDPAFLGREMERIKNWDFVPQKLKETPKKLGRWRRILSFLSWGIGKTLGKILPLLSAGPIFNFFAKRRARNRLNDMQERRKHEQIPGWNGAEYDPNANKGAQILGDFRRVPTVWSRPTAAKATGENGRPLDPVISIMIDQPKSMSAKTMDKKAVGHAMLGIEYSRFSKVTNRFERYNLQYGFYPQGNVGEKTSAVMMGIYKDARVPGELQNDDGHQYDISRSYPAKQRQVNKIIEASEHYADKGYGIFSRNCTTFVKEMVVDTAHLNISDDVFKMSDVRLSSMANLGLFAGSSLTSNAMAGTSNVLMDLGEEEDLTYHGYGNKRATQQDFQNYQNSIEENSGGYSKTTYSPAQTGENLRRTSGDNEGIIGSYKYEDPLKNRNGVAILSPFKLKNAIYTEGNALYNIFVSLGTAEMQEQMPSEALSTMTTLSAMGSSLALIDRKIDEYAKNNKVEKKDVKMRQAVPLDMIVHARQEISGYIPQVSKLLTKYFKNDKRLHEPVLHFISLLNHAVIYLDNLYRDRFNKENLDGDLENIRDEMGNGEYTIKLGEDKADFTPSHYESYLQIYKTPAAAIRAYHTYKDLKKKSDQNEVLSKAEKEEYEKLEKVEKLARDFDNSHNYMLEKDSYKQQDIDYAFQLREKERSGGVISGMFSNSNSSSGIYLSLILEKIFGGMTKRFMKEETEEGGISRGDVSNQKKMK